MAGFARRPEDGRAAQGGGSGGGGHARGFDGGGGHSHHSATSSPSRPSEAVLPPIVSFAGGAFAGVVRAHSLLQPPLLLFFL